MTILIFPAGMPRAVSFKAECTKQNLAVIGASSLLHDPIRTSYLEWAYLPYVNTADFYPALLDVIAKHGVTKIYSANPVVWGKLKSDLQTKAPQIELLGDAPAAEMLSGYRSSKNVADSLWLQRDFLSVNAIAAPRMSQIEFTSLVKHADVIPGMCDHQKLLALSEIFRCAVKGDVVEIGSWWGKSAFILSQLSRHYAIGNLLCIDPWSDAHLVQSDKLVDDASAEISAEEAHQVFIVNLKPYCQANINYLRMPSVEGSNFYNSISTVNSEPFGNTDYLGKISVLHIDGNHALEAVAADTKAWAKYVTKGGWIIFDDYRWPYGDGPRVVADDFITDNRGTIASAFYMGGSMFVQMSI